MKYRLEVGDRLYKIHYGKVIGYTTIKRVTKTRAIADNVKFKRDSTSYIRPIGASTWDNTSYKLETEELKTEFRKNKLISILKNYNYSELSLEQLTRVSEIFKEL